MFSPYSRCFTENILIMGKEKYLASVTSIICLKFEVLPKMRAIYIKYHDYVRYVRNCLLIH